MRIDRLSNPVTTYYPQEDTLRSDRALHPVPPRYFEYEGADNNEEKADQNEFLKNPPVRHYNPGGIPDQSGRAPKVIDVLVTLRNRDAAKGMQPPADPFPSYEFSEGGFQSTDQFYAMVRTAYTSLNRKTSKGQHVDRYI